MTNSKKPTSQFKTDCIGQCHRLNGFCSGCGRSNDEIFDWIILSEQEKKVILNTPRPDIKTK